MSKLTIELITEKTPGLDQEIGLNERKPKDVQYFWDQRLLKVFLGSIKDLTPEKVREKISEANWKDLSETEIELHVGNLGPSFVEAAYEMVLLKSFVFDKYKTSADDRHVQVKKVSYKPRKPEGFEVSLRDEIISAVKFCRDIVSSNADTINPGQMERFALEVSKQNNDIKCTVIDANQAKELGLNCLLAVGAESLKNNKKDFHPRLIMLEYSGPNYKPEQKNSKTKKKPVQHIALVGKGITFDTGGLCLKPTNYMLDMKSDMAGSAMVLSIFRAIANLAPRLRPDIKITGIMAVTENAFGGSSYKPGDILKAMNGKTIQVVDTDAEGRLVLADALSYVCSLKDAPTQIIDIATLTGSIVSTLGEVAAGAMTNNDEFFKKVSKSFHEEGERLWQMPMFEQYKKLLDSSIADIAHCNTRPDALCAAIFLKEFVKEGIDWLHLDIAGVGFIEHDGLWAYKGATGFGIKGLVKYILNV